MLERLEGRQERWPTTTSVALIMRNSDRSLVLVRKKDGGQWCLPAGGLLRGERLEEAAYRELRQETGLGPNDITNLGHPKVLDIPGETKTSIGLVYVVSMKEPLSREGIVPESGETDWVRPFTNDELAKLLQTPGEVYKPGFNIPAINYWFEYSREF